MNRKKTAIALIALVTAFFVTPMDASMAANSAAGTHPIGKKIFPTINSASTSKAGGQGAVTYSNGGKVIENPSLYVIWYGNWDASACAPTNGSASTESIITDFVSNLGGSDWNAINTTYFQKVNGKKSFVNGALPVMGCTTDSYSQGASLDGTAEPQISDVVNHSLSTNLLPTDTNGVYLVITSSDVTVNGFLTQFCAYHGAFSTGATTIKYAFAGDPSSNVNQCAAQRSISPNDNVVADAMVSVIAHEIVEAISDPELQAWFDQAGFENADKCAWTYGTAYQVANGAFANMQIGNRQYLIQRNVAANSNTCVLSLR